MLFALYLHLTFPKPVAVIGKNYRDMVVMVDSQYYAVNKLSSEFLKTIWSGRLAQKDISAMPVDVYKERFTTFQGGLKYSDKDIDIVFAIDDFDPKICDILGEKRAFIVDKLGGYGQEYSCDKKSYKIAPKIVRNWVVYKQGAFVIR